jgi:hypothetical protein
MIPTPAGSRIGDQARRDRLAAKKRRARAARFHRDHPDANPFTGHLPIDGRPCPCADCLYGAPENPAPRVARFLGGDIA